MTEDRAHFRAVLIALLLGLVLVAVATLAYRTTTLADQPGGNTAATAHHVTYKATSTAKTVLVTYTQGGNDPDGQTTGPSPWSMATTVTAGVAVLTVTIGSNAHNPDQADSVTCAIVDTTTGRTMVSNTVPPSPGATVTCVTGNLGA
jgi:hypothetical protein